MRTKFTHWAIFSAPMLVMLAVVWFSFPTEVHVALFFQEHAANNPGLALILKLVTDYSNFVFYIFYGWLLMMAFRSNNYEQKRYIVILLIVQAVISVLCVHFIKRTVGRPRPHQGWYFTPITDKGTYHSLPSGHTTEFTGWALPLVLRKHAVWLSAFFGLFAALVGFTRIYLGWHHPTDVFFGWLLGSFGGFTTAILAESTLFRKNAYK